MSSKKTNNIILCGFMASGKTSIAKALSKKLAYPHIDTDVLIIKESKMSISE
ncbi:MAG: shikimate kinase, partial [Lachnospiraceae bacterium]